MTINWHRAILTAAATALMLAALLLVLDLRTIAWRQDLNAQGASANLVAAALGLKDDAHHQVQLLDIQVKRTAVLTSATNASLNCAYVGQRLGKGIDATVCTAVGLLPTATATARLAGSMVRNTDRSLNDADTGLLAALGGVLRQLGAQVQGVGSGVQHTLTLSATSLESLNALLANPNLPLALTNFEKGTGAFARAGTTVDELLHDLAHPEKPGKFVRAVSIMLQILGISAKAGQTAPLFGR